MKERYKDYLFEKHILVSEGAGEEEHIFEILFAMAHFFGVKITKGEKFVRYEMIKELSERLGEYVPEPFYRGFPQSVRTLSTEELAFDQLLHYYHTYGLGNFENPGHSVFEKDFQRTAFQEDTDVQEFEIQTEEEAQNTIDTIVHDLAAGSRPLNERQYLLLVAYIRDHADDIPEIASKNTLARLLMDTRQLSLADRLNLSDIMKVVDEMNYRRYRNDNLKKLNFRNQDRKFFTALLDRMFRSGRCDIRTCYEKKQLWNGFLHQIHYQPKNEAARIFVDGMRTKGNESVYSEFEKLMRENRHREAAALLQEKKGSSALLRNLNYIISRMDPEEEQTFLSKFPADCSTLLLLQLLFWYETKEKEEGRIFRFSRHNLGKMHCETPEEQERRKSNLTEEQKKRVGAMLHEKLAEKLKNRLGKVYIAPSMKNYALPMAENTAQGGLGVLAKGSKLPIAEGKKVRAFVYWEKIDDIDLSVFALKEDGTQKEFSWRTMSGQQSKALTFSGDETSGYYGGSEYFDVNIPKVKELYPDYRYMNFCANVYSGVNFDECFCKAGFMLRDQEDSGQVYEPKTVRSAYLVNCANTFAYLFGIDLHTNELVWLNEARNSRLRIAGDSSLSVLMDNFRITEIMNVQDFFAMMAEEIVEDPMEAEIVVTDHEVACADGAEIVREYDFEKMKALME